MRVLYLWSRLTGYMSACWRELNTNPDVELKVVARHGRSQDPSDPKFGDSLLEGFDHELFEELPSSSELAEYARKFDPQIVVLSGWFIPQYVSLVKSSLPSSVKIVLCSDNPIQFTWRQSLARWKIGWLLNRADCCMVPGERAFQLMKYWGVPDRKIRTGLYGIDTTILEPIARARPESGAEWPRSFVYVGRYNKRKAIDVLVTAYEKYRATRSNPWGLTVCGNGELENLLVNRPGITDLGFVQPASLPAVLNAASVFVLPSRFDTWGAVIAEAFAAGMPVICTSSCGASADLVRNEVNGLVVAPGDPELLSLAMQKMHDRYAELFDMGRIGAVMAGAYSAKMWSRKWTAMFSDLLQ